MKPGVDLKEWQVENQAEVESSCNMCENSYFDLQ